MELIDIDHGLLGDSVHEKLETHDEDPAAIERLASELMTEHPVAGFADDLKKTNISDWAEESVQISLQTVYHNLDPEITNFAAVPAGYDADAELAARKRITLAGYRLADELRRLVLDLK